ncbi:MAG: 3-phosphoshikimate 1-carboxyvinyltransferase [Thermoplasmatota archaeon]
MRIRAGSLSGRAVAPPSKSETHRALLLAAQAAFPCRVAAPLVSADTAATLGCLVALGARPEVGRDIHFTPAPLAPTGATLECANSGTTLRLLAATVARWGTPVTLDGDSSLRRRSSAPLWQALASGGVSCRSRGGLAPVTLQGPLRGGAFHLPAGASSQFASALLLSLPFVGADSTVALESPIASRPYVDVTLAVAREAGLAIEEGHPGLFRIRGRQGVTASRLSVGGDWSSAAFLLAGAAVTGGAVTVTGLQVDSMQGDRSIVEQLERFGARVQVADGQATCQGGSLASPGTVDVTATPDLFPILAVVAACARGTTHFVGGSQLRAKESDRIEAMAAGLRALGVKATPGPETLTVEGAPGHLAGAHLKTHGDHRIHMALAVAALAASGSSEVEGPDSVAVSYPSFHADLRTLGAAVES